MDKGQKNISLFVKVCVSEGEQDGMEVLNY